MARFLGKVVAAVLAFGALGSAAEAQQIAIRITTSDGAYATVGSRFAGDDFGRGRHFAPLQRDWERADGPRYAYPPRYGHEYRDPNRYYGRPVPERGYWAGHGYGRPVAARRHWDRHQDCRTVVKRMVSAWGHVTIKERRICD